jgi:hypothetical protein
MRQVSRTSRRPAQWCAPGAAAVNAQVLVADDAALWTFLQEVVRPMAGVLETDCTLEIKVHKLWFDTTPST